MFTRANAVLVIVGAPLIVGLFSRRLHGAGRLGGRMAPARGAAGDCTGGFLDVCGYFVLCRWEKQAFPFLWNKKGTARGKSQPAGPEAMPLPGFGGK